MTIILQEGFETGAWTHDVRKFRQSGWDDVQIGNIFVPESWNFWFVESDIFNPPGWRT